VIKSIIHNFFLSTKSCPQNSNLGSINNKIISNYYPDTKSLAIDTMLIATGGNRIIIRAKDGITYEASITKTT
jgi:hypothetical protein